MGSYDEQKRIGNTTFAIIGQAAVAVGAMEAGKQATAAIDLVQTRGGPHGSVSGPDKTMVFGSTAGGQICVQHVFCRAVYRRG